jgi:F0F1-type ATP synthase membrane subunit b/b'
MPHTYEQRKQYLAKLQQENPQKYEEIKQKKREANKKYCETHKEQIKEYRETHKEQIKQKEKEYRETHKEQIKETKKKYLNRLQQENPDWDIDDIIDMGENILFNRAYSFISKLDINDPTHSETLNTFADTILLKCLVTSIKHYELLEEFEKCAFLLNIKNYVVECI